MDFLSVGVFAQAFGVNGWCKARAHQGECGHFRGFREISLESDGTRISYDVEGIRCSGKTAVFKLKGVNDRETAKKLAGKAIWVERKYAQRLGEKEYYSGDICECRLYSGEKCIGEIVAVCENPAHDILEIRDEEGRRHLIPFVEHFIGSVDLKNKRIELKEDYILR